MGRMVILENIGDSSCVFEEQVPGAVTGRFSSIPAVSAGFGAFKHSMYIRIEYPLRQNAFTVVLPASLKTRRSRYGFPFYTGSITHYIILECLPECLLGLVPRCLATLLRFLRLSQIYHALHPASKNHTT